MVRCSYCALESGWTALNAFLVSALGLSALYGYYLVRQDIFRTELAAFEPELIVKDEGGKEGGNERRLPLSTFLPAVGGWLWTLSCVLLLQPLFSIPVQHAVSEVYARSFVVGPLIQTVAKIHSEVDWLLYTSASHAGLSSVQSYMEPLQSIGQVLLVYCVKPILAVKGSTQEL